MNADEKSYPRIEPAAEDTGEFRRDHWRGQRPDCRTTAPPWIFWNAPRWTRRSVRTKFSPSPARCRTKPPIPARHWPTRLKLVAKLIGGGLPTRIYYVSQGGYDTHTNQLGQHQRLLQDMGDSLKAFVADLKAHGRL